MSGTYVRVMVGLMLWGVFSISLGIFFALGLLLCAASIYVSIARNLEIDTIGILVLANVAYWILSGFSVDALDIASFLNPKFYTGEGRILLSLVPLLALCFVSVGTQEFKGALKNILLIGFASMGIYLIWAVTHTPMLAGEGHADEFHGLLTSHTGSGTFFGCIAIFCILFNAERRSIIWLVVSLLLLAPMFSSGSREALVGSVAAMGWYWGLKRKHPRILAVVALIILILIPTAGTMSNKTYNRTFGMLSWETVESIVDQTKYGIQTDWAVGDWTPDGGTDNLESGDVTTLVRIMLWVYATKRFLDSPVFGMGWGRFNDQNLVMLEVEPVLAVAGEGEQVFSTSNAHNSYFQLLSESGILGVVLYLSLWITMYFRCYKAEKIFFPLQTERAYYVACQGLVVYILVCALTGHALASPSVMVPVVTIIGVGVAYFRTVIKRRPPPD